jgi:hypothetical protein
MKEEKKIKTIIQQIFDGIEKEAEGGFLAVSTDEYDCIDWEEFKKKWLK